MKILNFTGKVQSYLFIFFVFSLFHLNSLFASNFLTGPDILISDTLINSTFKIQGSETCGTVFIMGHKFPGVNTPPGQAVFVLFTAAHVLEDIKEDHATIFWVIA